MARRESESSATESLPVLNQIVPVAGLVAHPQNYKGHPAGQVERLRLSLRKFGQVRSIVVQAQAEPERYTIVAGHGVVQAAQAEGYETLRADVLPATWPAERVKAYLVADNELGRLAQDDDAQLAALIAEARAFDSELLGAMGYDEAEFQALLASVAGDANAAQEDPGAQIDKAEELQAKWNVQPGDLWQLGAHRLICGDCTDAATVARVMGGEKAQLVVTSPPYWVGKDYETQTTLQEVCAFIDACCESMTSAANSDGGRIIINCSTASARAINPKADVETMFTLAWWQDAMRGRNWLMRHCRVWIKGGDMGAPSVAARSDVVDQHWETIPEFLPTFYYPDGLRRGQEKIGMKWAQLGVWNDIPGERSADDTHCAAFPVELPSRYIRLYTVFNESVYEPFSGSGTTLIACERLGRKCRAIEIAPKYCAVALERWATMTGQTPVLVRDG